MMSTERLKVLHSRATRNRKFLCVMNDVAKKQEDLYDGYVDREKLEAAQRLEKSIVCTRRNIVRRRVLKECMKATKEDLQHKQKDTDLYGQYHGVPVEHIAGEIDHYLEDHHPRIRRKQKIQQLFEEGYEKGAILAPETIKGKVKDYFDRPLVEIHHIEPDELQNLPPREPTTFLPPVTSGFYTGNVYARFGRKKSDKKSTPGGASDDADSQRKLFVTRKVTKFLTEHVPDNVSLRSLQPASTSKKSTSVRPTTLPAIKPEKDVHRGPKKAESIGDLVDRFSKRNTEQTSVGQPQATAGRANDAGNNTIPTYNNSYKHSNTRKMTNGSESTETETGHKQNRKERAADNEHSKSKSRREKRERKPKHGDKDEGQSEDGAKSLTLPPLKVKAKKKPQSRHSDMGMTI